MSNLITMAQVERPVGAWRKRNARRAKDSALLRPLGYRLVPDVRRRRRPELQINCHAPDVDDHTSVAERYRAKLLCQRRSLVRSVAIGSFVYVILIGCAAATVQLLSHAG